MKDARKIDEFSIFGVLRPQTLLQKVIASCLTMFSIPVVLLGFGKSFFEIFGDDKMSRKKIIISKLLFLIPHLFSTKSTECCKK